MTKNKVLKIILGISIVGILFSGYLSYGELFRGVCPLGGCSSVLGFPACVYGLMMYLVIFVFTIFGLRSKT